MLQLDYETAPYPSVINNFIAYLHLKTINDTD